MTEIAKEQTNGEGKRQHKSASGPERKTTASTSKADSLSILCMYFCVFPLMSACR